MKLYSGCAAAALILLVAWGFASAAEPAAPLAATPERAVGSSLAVIAQTVARQIDAFSPGQSAAAWLKENPGGKLIVREAFPYTPDSSAGRGDWCFRTERVVLAEAGTPAIVRKIYFYPPRMPPDGALPALSRSGGDAVAKKACQAQMMRLEVDGLDPASASSVSQAIELQLSGYLGRRRVIIPKPSRTDLMGLVRWHKGSTAIAIERYSSHDDVIASTPKFQEAIAAANAQIALGPDYRLEGWILDQAIKAAAPDPGLAKLLAPFHAVAAASAGSRPQPERAPRGEDVVRAVEDLLRDSARWPPARRAAAMVACDRVIAIAEQAEILDEAGVGRVRRGRRTPGQPEIVRRLGQLGARFDYSERAGQWYYALTFAERARRLDPGGRAGDLGYLAMAERGFDPSSTCARGSEQFKRVITQATPLMTGKPDPDVALRVHMLVGDAYAAPVALSGAARNDFFDPERYRSAVLGAREKAIEKYRAVLAIDPHGPLAAEAWNKAWRLTAGLPPMSIRFYCVYQ